MKNFKTAALQCAFNHATAWLEDIDDRPVCATTNAKTLRARLDIGLSELGIDPTIVIEELVTATAGGHMGSAGGRFFGWVMGGAHSSALAADWLASAWDQNAAIHASAPAAAVVEEIAGDWLKDILRLPSEASFAFTTGCQLAHFTCLAAARHAVLNRCNWDVSAKGLYGAPRVRIVASENRHASIDRCARFLGFGSDNIEGLPVDIQGCIEPGILEAALSRNLGPTIVVLSAADLNIAAFDSFQTLIPIAKRHAAWVHIDGAFGLFAQASAQKRHLTAGVELADSWGTDAHKWLNVPFDCGVAFVRDSVAHRAAMTISASYLAANDGNRDQIDWNPEWSRRARGFAVYAALRELGREGIENLVNQTCTYCSDLVTGIGAMDGAELLCRSELNQGLVRFLEPRDGADEIAHDRRTDTVVAAINASGEAFFSGTTWRGRRAMRVSVVNWRTDSQDVKRTLAAVRAALASTLAN